MDGKVCTGIHRSLVEKILAAPGEATYLAMAAAFWMLHLHVGINMAGPRQALWCQPGVQFALVLTTKQEAQRRQSHSPQRDTGTDPEAACTRRTMGNSH